MNVAVRVTGERGVRAVRAIVADPDVARVGVLGASPSDPDPRLAAVSDPGGFDVLVADPDDLGAAVEEAVRA
ncbi:MAG: hypothetical protein ACRDVM_03365, partial [Acidimicrobiia bacterium]